MQSWTLALALAAALAVSIPHTLRAATSGGHGGGHGSAGHAGGGHSGGGHSGGGHSGGGHAGGGHAGGSRPSGSAHASAATPRAVAHAASSTGRGAGRPRDGHPIVGTAVPRMTTLAPLVVTSVGGLPSSRWPYSTAVGFGAFGFYSDPLGSRHGYGGYETDPQDSVGAEDPTGGLRLRVTPTDAEVYVDGSFAGIVADFDGAFHHLTLTAGPHRIEIRAPGYQPIVFDVAIQPRHTTQYRGALPR